MFKKESIQYIRDDRPAYRVLDERGFFGDDDSLHLLDSEIYWDGEPNEQLEPLNQMAHDNMETYLNKLDRLGREVQDKTGKAFAGRPRDVDGGIIMATAVARADMSIFGKMKQDTNTQTIQKEETPETGSVNPKRGPGRPKKISAVA